MSAYYLHKLRAGINIWEFYKYLIEFFKLNARFVRYINSSYPIYINIYIYIEREKEIPFWENTLKSRSFRFDVKT